MADEVQFFYYSSTAGYVCGPKVVGETRTWDPRPDSNWTLRLGGNRNVDLIKDAGFSPGDVVTAWVNVQFGNDASSDQSMVVSQDNSATANFTAQGVAYDSNLEYTGMS